MTVSKEFEAAVRAARHPKTLEAAGTGYAVYDVSGVPGADRLPRALVVLLENCVRRAATDEEAVELASRVVEAALAGEQGREIQFMPSRVLFQDFTGVPVFVDFAAMRDAMVERGGDPSKVSPRIPCTLVVDHSVIADVTGTEDAALQNQRKEAQRNRERFAFLKWAANSFDNVRIVPPGEGICHQLNMERFSQVVGTDALAAGDEPVACFDTLVGTDSHTTTANGLGVLGWGVGGIEAEAAALGQPISMLVPPVVSLRLTGRLRDGASGMDLALTVAQLLRAEGVVGTLVEVTGDGVQTLTATQRACVANMTPEYGATTTLFPVDERSVEYLRLTGRSDAQVELIRSYLGMQGVFGQTRGRTYAREVTLDLATVEPSLAGPSRPHDRVTPAGLPESFSKGLAAHGVKDPAARFDVALGEKSVSLGHGAIAIAAITSCTTATDPAMMVGAGILAKKAVERGLAPKPWVKKVLAPGSRVTSLMLERAGLTGALRKLGFYTCGFGCMSCIGNSGDIPESLKELSSSMELTSVLSGNRNFEGRISPYVSQNYLMQPALVVAYSLVGTVDVDLAHEAVGVGADGSEVMLRDIMPTNEEIAAVLDEVLTPELFAEGSRGLFEGSSVWRDIDAGSSDTFDWDEDSTYVRRAPYFDDAVHRDVVEVRGARALALLGDFVTTDHISPAGAIAPDSPAARYLREHGVRPEDFNTYGSRRGNHEVMMRGTFANVKLSNALADGRKGGWTRDFVDGKVKSIFDASVDYAEHGIPLVVVAGKLYGSGSSRDWAGKGPALLGVRAVIAQSFERIHRSNLVQMGVLPLQLREGESAEALGLDGTETFDVSPVDVSDGLPVDRTATVTATKADGTKIVFECVVRVDTPMEGDYLSSGGILPYVLDELAE
ncbi:aconitate hydratase AcnA [Parafannyhessea umbonata]|uniref:aconitate hydratase AcnA n=1 Tax=Parafannyhessea umbonata TaxID=604330 RepID=UPI00359C79AD